MKCSICGGSVLGVTYSVYYSDGSTSGYYSCQDCGKKKDYFIQGGEERVIDMGDKK